MAWLCWWLALADNASCVKCQQSLVILNQWAKTLLMLRQICRKRLMDSAESCRSNWAKSIIHRREAQTRLNRLHDSLRLLEGRVIRQVEENEERIAILQSLMEEPSGDGRRSVRSEDEQGETGRRLRRSQKELAEAEDLQADLTSVESFSCELSLRRLSDGSCFRLKSALDAQPLSYGNSSAQGPCVGAAMSLLTLIVRLTKEADLWEPGETVADLSLTPASAAAGSSISGSVGASASVSDTASASDSLANTGSPLLGLLSALQPSRPPDFCYLQFSVNGELRKPVVIKLMHEYAPAMCHHFVKYCDGSFRLAYQGSPVRLVWPIPWHYQLLLSNGYLSGNNDCLDVGRFTSFKST